MDYKTTVKYWSKVWDKLVGYIDEFNWAYIGVGIFASLFALFLYDTLASSQVSLKFLAIFVLVMGLAMFLGLNVVGGFGKN